ncbi:DUF6531 domain-containing protein, partial [Pseudomonas synxantha]
MDQTARIEQELDHFPHTLSLYREQLGRFLNRRADQISHALDLPSLMGMDRRIKLGDTSKVVSSGDDDFFSTVAQCPANGILLIESQFESVYDIPLGNIQVEVVAREGGERTRVTLDEQGKGQFEGTPGKSYWVHVQSAVTPAQVSELFKSYDGLTAQLQDWLRGEWQGFKPRWPQSTAAAVGNGLLAGSWAALVGVWDRVGELSAILQDPRRFAEQLGDGARQLAELAEKTPEAMARLLLLASDEAVLCLLLRTASLWLEMLPPSVMAGATAESLSRFAVELLLDLLIGVVLTFAAAGAGVAYLSMRLARHGAQLLDVVLGFVKAIFGLVSQFIGYVDRYKTVAARGVAAGLKKGRMQLRWQAQRNTTLKQHEHHDDASVQAKNPNGDSADTVERTATNKCPVSMVTGEELLTLTDGHLDGVLPFDFTRLYRTSAVELDCGLGFGWSHSLSQRLELDGEQLLWIDAENRRTPFPRPTAARPVIHNSLSRAAIYLGEEPDELILALAGETPRFYHFRDGRLTAISDAYGNRLSLRRDYRDRVERLDNGAGRSLYLRYELKHLVAIDYQVQQRADSEARSWRTEQTLVTYRYDARQRLIEVSNAAGESERYDYDEQHVILQRQLAGGASFFWAWERAGKAARCVRHWASFAQMEARYVWDDHGSVTVQNSDGSRELYEHDERARLVRRVDLDGGERHTAYDAQGRLIAEQDALGAVTEYRYDELGRLIARLPPDEAPTAYEYRHGFLHSRTRGEATWTYERNAQGDVSALTDPDGQVTRYFYDPQGRLLTIRYPDQSGHHFVWNGLGQLLEETLPDGGQRAFAYDALGRRITQRDEHGGVTAFAWDAVGRLIQTIFPTGARRSYAYNAYGQVTAETDELGRVTRFEYADDLHLV